MATSLNPLSASAIVIRRVHDTNLAEEVPVPPSDFHSNDYLSLTTNPRLRDAFLRRPIQGPATLGSGSRVHATDNVQHSHAAFEERMRDFFHADAALLFPSSHDATLAFWHSVPKDGDAVIFDELVNKSIRAGIAASPCRERQYAFRHSSVVSLRESIARVLRDQPSIAAGQSTLFLAVESLYSMDGDLAPLRDIVQTIEQLVPKGAAHMVVDEAHTTGLLGRDGRGLVSALGLEKRVDSVLHAFSKAWGLSGALLLVSPTVKRCVTEHSRPVVYTSPLPSSHISALNTAWEYVAGPEGAELRKRLRRLTTDFEEIMREIMKHIPPNLLLFRPHDVHHDYPTNAFSPIFSFRSRASQSLVDFLAPLGFAVSTVRAPLVPAEEERIRIVLHAGNLREELYELAFRLLQWATMVESLEEYEREKRHERPVALRARL